MYVYVREGECKKESNNRIIIKIIIEGEAATIRIIRIIIPSKFLYV